MSGQAVQPAGGELSLASQLNLGALVALRAVAAGDRTFLSWFAAEDEREPHKLTWSEFANAVDATVDYLDDAGVGPDDTVCLHAQNAPESVLLLVACAQVGARFVPTNWRLTAGELSYILRDSAARFVVADEHRVATATEAARFDAGLPVSPLGQLRATWSSRLHGEPPSAPDPAQADQPRLHDLVVLYTSGTTSAPKGVLVSEAALLHAGYHIAAFSGFTSSDRNLAVLPMSHINGLGYNVMTAIAMGGSLCVVERFSASRYWEQAQLSGATVGWLAGTPMRMILAQPQRPADNQHSMRLVIFGQNLTPRGFQSWRQRFGTDLLQIYGMTETVTLPIANRLTGPRADAAMGVPAPGVLARLADDGQVLASTTGTRGELQLLLSRRHHMMSGYLNQPEATAQRFTDDGWFRTGDVVEIGPDALLYFVDRDRDIIKVKGENVSASEVEQAIQRHAAVADAAVAGVPDPLTDEAIVAFVVAERPPLDPDALLTYLAGRLADFKLPTSIVEVESLPRTSTGKVQKSVLLSETATGGR